MLSNIIFYDFCSFSFDTVNSMDKLLLLYYIIFAGLLPILDLFIAIRVGRAIMNSTPNSAKIGPTVF